MRYRYVKSTEDSVGNPKWNFTIRIGDDYHYIGLSHELYKIRYKMLSRCYNQEDKEFGDYGAKGIKVCDEWKNGPDVFYEWALLNKWKPGVSVDRSSKHIASNADYGPSTCKLISSSGKEMVTSTLNEWDVRQIRSWTCYSSVNLKKLAAEFGVTLRTILDIKNRRTWKHIT